MLKEMNTIADFVTLNVGEVVMLHGQKGVYVGKQLMKTCNCSVPNCSEFPFVARPKPDGVDGEIELLEIRSQNKPKPRQCTGASIVHSIGKNHEVYQALREQLITAGLIAG